MVEYYNDKSRDLIGLTKLKNDNRFKDINGTNQTIVVIDTGINNKSTAFGEDKNNDGIPDRIVYQYDFADNDTDASDKNSHGSQMTSIAAGSTLQVGSRTLEGLAPDSNIIALKVFKNNTIGSFTYIEKALQWVVQNANKYNITAINMSLGDTQNHLDERVRYSVGDELEQIDKLGIVNVAAAGNNYAKFKTEGISYPGSDKSVLSVGAVYSSNTGSWTYGEARAYSTTADQITPFSQRSDKLDLFAPGASIAAINTTGGISTGHGTSQATAFVSGSVLLLQEASQKYLNRKLSTKEVNEILKSTADTIKDGDDEKDNMPHTEKYYKRINIFKAVEKLYFLGGGTNQNNDEVTIKNVSVNEGNTDFTKLNFEINLNQSKSTNYVINYNTVGIEATQWQDFIPKTGNLTFLPGETSKTISIDVRGEKIYENNETLILNVKTPTEQLKATGTIINDDSLPVLTIKNGYANEGSIAKFGLILSNPSANPISFDILTGYSNTANASDNLDFEGKKDSITFSPGQTYKTFDVQTNRDALKELTENFNVIVKNITGCTLDNNSSLKGFIMDQPFATDTTEISPDVIYLPHFNV